MIEPPAEVDINESIIRGLIDDQFPLFKEYKISFLDTGWDNVNYRLGSDYIIRLPRRSGAIDLLKNEINWLPRLEASLPINIPAPIHVGQPSDLYPWQWSIIPWYDGANGCIALPNDNQVIVLADFLNSLHQHHPTDAPYNDHRCLPLLDKSEDVFDRIHRLRKKNDLIDNQIFTFWEQAVNEPVSAEHSLIHGDMHPRNMVINKGKINAIIDWGDITSGDVATDVASIWMLFDKAEIRKAGFDRYGADQSLINRARGWAIFFATLFLELGDAAGGEYQAAGDRIVNNLKN